MDDIPAQPPYPVTAECDIIYISAILLAITITIAWERNNYCTAKQYFFAREPNNIACTANAIMFCALRVTSVAP